MKTPPKVSERKLPGRSFRFVTPGFRLWVPHSVCGNSTIRIGTVDLRLSEKYGVRLIHGRVPDSWLVDLNAGGCAPDPEPEIAA
jgi:hypothetical protein